jgi:circadian clock protein KaiC
MGSVGLRLDRWLADGTLRVYANRPTQSGLESHLTTLYQQVEDFTPDVVVIDPVTDFTALGTSLEVKAMLMRIVDYLKTQQISAVFTSLVHEGGTFDDPSISSLIDNWLQLRNLERNDERNRGLFIQKARGMSHSHQVREFLLDDDGIRLLDAVSGPDRVLTGRARHPGEVPGRA